MLLFRASRKRKTNQFAGGHVMSVMEINGNEINRSNPKAQKPIANHHNRK